MAEERSAPTIADPAALGLAAFALTTFLLSLNNAFGDKVTPLLAFYGFAAFYGGTVQLLAGMWEFKNRNTFGATAFSTYGGFWLGLAVFVGLVVAGKVPAAQVAPSIAWILVAFAIFNTYMMIWSLRLNVAVFGVFLTLEATEILLFIGNFRGQAGGVGVTAIGGYVGILTALVAWYTSAAIVANSLSDRPILPVGGPLWRRAPVRRPTVAAAPAGGE
jgi:succinate-acetate transporter protein